MARRLKIDLDRLEATIKTYKSSYEDFEELISTLDASLDALKGTGWKSAASDAFFDVFDNTWRKNMKTHMLIINHLKECLENASSEYEAIYNKIPSLGNQL